MDLTFAQLFTRPHFSATLSISALIGFLIFLISYPIQHIWAWIEDTKCGPNNAVLNFTMTKILNYELAPESLYMYKHPKTKQKTNGDPGLLVLFFGLPTLLLAFVLYKITIICLILYFIAYTLRLTRRVIKSLKKHTTDPNAHKV